MTDELYIALLAAICNFILLLASEILGMTKKVQANSIVGLIAEKIISSRTPTPAPSEES